MTTPIAHRAVQLTTAHLNNLGAWRLEVIQFGIIADSDCMVTRTTVGYLTTYLEPDRGAGYGFSSVLETATPTRKLEGQFDA